MTILERQLWKEILLELSSKSFEKKQTTSILQRMSKYLYSKLSFVLERKFKKKIQSNRAKTHQQLLKSEIASNNIREDDLNQWPEKAKTSGNK